MGDLVELAESVLVTTSSIERMTTTVVIGEAGGCLLVDPGGTPEEMAELAAALAARGVHPVAAFSSHAHWRHALWHADLGDVPRYVTAAAAAWAEERREAIEAEVEEAGLGHDTALVARFTPLEEDADSLPWEGPDAAIGALRGHAPGHAALYFPDLELLVAGDMCSDVRIPILDLAADEPVEDYRAAIELIGGLDGVSVVVPAHGSPCDADGLAARLALDEAYLAALAGGTPSTDERLASASPWVLARHEEQAARLLGAAATAEEERPPEPSGPIEVDLPEVASTWLAELASSLEAFCRGAATFLETNRLDVAELANALEPVTSAEEFAATEVAITAWSAEADGQSRPFERLLTLLTESHGALNDYLAALKLVFANAVVPEPPAEEEAADTGA